MGYFGFGLILFAIATDCFTVSPYGFILCFIGLFALIMNAFFND